MQTLQFKTNAEIVGVKPRLEGSRSEDEQTRSLDIKCKGTIPGQVLAPLLGVDSEHVSQFWTKTGTEHPPAFPALGVCKSKRVFDNCNLVLDKRKFQSAQVRGFQFEIEPEQMVSATFTVRLYDLSDATVGALIKDYRETVAIEIESAQMDAFDNE